jgi:hypothetical protein
VLSARVTKLPLIHFPHWISTMKKRHTQEHPTPSRKTIYRIKKLLERSADSSADETARSKASRRASELLAKWNLNADDLLPAKPAKPSESEPIDTVSVEKSFYAGGDRWAVGLYNVISVVNGCEYSCDLNCSVTNEKGKKVLGVRHNIRGLRTNVAMTCQMTEGLLEAVKQAARDAMKGRDFANEPTYLTAPGVSIHLAPPLSSSISEILRRRSIEELRQPGFAL